MAKCEYNGETIDYQYTRGIESRPEYTPDQGDYLGTDHTIRVEGVVHGDDNQDVVAEYARIRHALEMPRAKLKFSVDGATLIESDEKLDLSHGPHPELVSLDQIVGTVSFRVSFVIKTRLWGCGPAPRYLSNRWEEDVTIGADHLTKVIRTGTLYTRGDLNLDTDATRGVVTPPIGRNFNRVHANYKIRSDFLAMSYVFIDQEVEAQPPAPAIHIDDATYTETSPNGAILYGDVRVALTGRPRGDRKALLSTAVMMCVRRLQGAGAMRPGTTQKTTLALSERMHKNQVTVQMRTIVNASLKPTGGDRTTNAAIWGTIGAIAYGPFGMVIGAVGGGAATGDKPVMPRLPEKFEGYGELPAGSNPDKVPDPTLRGAAGLVMVAAALNDPCLKKTVELRARTVGSATLASAPADGTSSAPTIAVPPASVAVVGTIDPFPLTSVMSAAADVLRGVYTDSRITCRWEGDQHIAHLAPTTTDRYAKSAFVALGGATKQLIVEYKVERVGAPPQIPPRDLGSNFVLLAETSSPQEAVIGSDGVTPTQRTSGSRIYGVRDPSQLVEGGAIPPSAANQLLALRLTGDQGTATQIERLLQDVAKLAGGVEASAILPWADQRQLGTQQV